MTAIAHQPHPVSRALAGVRDQLSEVAGIPVWSMDATETTTAIAEVQAAEAQLAELEGPSSSSHADRIDIAGNTGATSTANWHAVATRTTRVAGTPGDAARRRPREPRRRPGPRSPRAGSMSSRPRPSSAP